MDVIRHSQAAIRHAPNGNPVLPRAADAGKEGEHGPARVQLWSYNYDPEPTGIGPVSRVLAEGLHERGHSVDVVTAHPHYPEARWGVRRRPYRETRNGIPVLRLPLWVGRASTFERYRQELTYMASLFAALPVLGRPDVIISASPSFPALLPAIMNTRARHVPWLLWLQDILPDGAAATGVVRPGVVMDAARHLERVAYRDADLIVVPSHYFAHNLDEKGVPPDDIRLIHNPSTRIKGSGGRARNRGPGLRILSMGNIGRSQGLAPLVETFEGHPATTAGDARLVITGTGVAADEVREKIRSDRVKLLGLVDDDHLEAELQQADIALVSQQSEGTEFNIPSKLMNFMAYGLPVLAAVNPRSEVARMIRDSGAGWVVDSSRPQAFPEKVAELVRQPTERAEKGQAAAAYADLHFSRGSFVELFDAALHEALPSGGKTVETSPGREGCPRV